MIFTTNKTKHANQKNDLTPKLELSEQELELVSGEDKSENVCGGCPQITIVAINGVKVYEEDPVLVQTKANKNVQQTNVRKRHVRDIFTKNKQGVSVKGI